ncbi:hypothetical protein L208DRAFT_1417619 [Tricholoma matsutake]|nr:hypothetical protein L208DRAFT_1417619 [Tricholoma matsutake 945]
MSIKACPEFHSQPNDVYIRFYRSARFSPRSEMNGIHRPLDSCQHSIQKDVSHSVTKPTLSRICYPYDRGDESLCKRHFL